MGIVNADLVDDYYVSDYVWPVCYDVVNFGLCYTVPVRPSPPSFLLDMVVMILYFRDVAHSTKAYVMHRTSFATLRLMLFTLTISSFHLLLM